MTHKKGITVLSIILAFLTAIGISLYIYLNPPLAKVVHYHAGFQVYIDGKLQNFSDNRYMSIKPCSDEKQEKRTPAHEQLEKAHLHDNVGYVVHVHRDNSYWKDLFQNLEYSLPPHKSLEVLLNGQRTNDIFNKRIMAYDSVIFLVGSHQNPQNYLKQAITKKQILTEEDKKESCGL